MHVKKTKGFTFYMKTHKMISVASAQISSNSFTTEFQNVTSMQTACFQWFCHLFIRHGCVFMSNGMQIRAFVSDSWFCQELDKTTLTAPKIVRFVWKNDLFLMLFHSESEKQTDIVTSKGKMHNNAYFSIQWLFTKSNKVVIQQAQPWNRMDLTSGLVSFWKKTNQKNLIWRLSSLTVFFFNEQDCHPFKKLTVKVRRHTETHTHTHTVRTQRILKLFPNPMLNLNSNLNINAKS